MPAAPFRLGVFVSLTPNPATTFAHVRDLGFSTCQVGNWDAHLWTDEIAERLREAADDYEIEITTLWAGVPGERVWNFVDGPRTIGLVPAEGRAEKVAALQRASDFARLVGVGSITTHVGFIPDDPHSPVYRDVLAALRGVVARCLANGQEFWFETGQETPVTLLRTIEDLGAPNLGINLDPANLLLYGKANPVDSLDVFGSYVRGVHAKDGEYPTNGSELGAEKALGQGRVHFPALLARLHSLGYTGALTIEREISGAQQIADIQAGKTFLEEIVARLGKDATPPS